MSNIDNDDPVNAFPPEEPLPTNPDASSSEDFSPQSASDQQERDFWVLPAAIDSSRPTSRLVPVGPDFWVSPAALDSARRTSRLVPVGKAIVLVALMAIVALRVFPWFLKIEVPRVAHAEIVKAPQLPMSPRIDDTSATAPHPVTKAAPAQQIANRQDRASSSPPPTVTSSKAATGRPPATPSRASPSRTAAVAIRPSPPAAVPIRPGPDVTTRTAAPTQAADVTLRPEPSSTATAVVPAALVPASRPPESSPIPPSAPPAPSITAAATTAAVAPAAASEKAVRSVLGRYASAYRRLNVGEAKAVWPSVDTKALGRAFAGLKSQAIYFRDCRVSVAGTTAKAHCVGTTQFVPKVGNRTKHLESREWTFEMKKTGEEWTIAHLDVH